VLSSVTELRQSSTLSSSATSPSTQADASVTPATETSISEKSQKISKAMKAYLERATTFS